jgi:hypothetical protein
VAIRTRETYQTLWNQLPLAALANIDQIMTTIRLVRVDFGSAEYEMLRDEQGEAFSYGAWSELDQDGLWRLRNF